MAKYERYINNIQSKKVNHGKWISQLVAWHLNQIKKLITDEQANQV